MKLKPDMKPLLDGKGNTVNWVVIAHSYGATGRDHHSLLYGSDEGKGYCKVTSASESLSWSKFYVDEDAYKEHCSSPQVGAQSPSITQRSDG